VLIRHLTAQALAYPAQSKQHGIILPVDQAEDKNLPHSTWFFYRYRHCRDHLQDNYSIILTAMLIYKNV